MMEPATLLVTMGWKPPATPTQRFCRFLGFRRRVERGQNW